MEEKKLFLISLIEFFFQMEMKLIFQKKRNLKLEIIYLNGLEPMKGKADNFSIDPRIAFMINDILKEAAQRGTGRKINELGRKDFAAKTGTSNDAESTWFTGFNENILTTVWFGYDNPSSLGNNEFGSTTSLPIWLNYKKQIIDTIPKGKFKKPSGLIARKINLETGELAKPEDESVKFELFLN